MLPLRVQEVTLDGAHFWQRTELTKRQREFFAKLGFDAPPERFVTSPAADRSPHQAVSAPLG